MMGSGCSSKLTVMQEMASAATIAVFLLCCFCVSSTGSQDVCDQYAAPGTSVTLPLKHALKESDNLKWYKDGTVIFIRRGTKLSKGKNDDGSLKLTELTKEMSGRYNPEIYDKDGNGAGDLGSMRLCVIDHVQKPRVTVTCTDSNTNVSFTCSAGQGESVEWFMDGKKLEEKHATLMRATKDAANALFSCSVSNAASSEISASVQQDCYAPVQKPRVTNNCTSNSEVTFTCTVSKRDKHVEFKWFTEDQKLRGTGDTLTVKVKDVENTRFFCNVSNPVSSEISSPAVQNCSNPFFPDELFGISIWFYIGGGGGFVVLVILIVVVCCVRARRKKRLQ